MNIKLRLIPRIRFDLPVAGHVARPALFDDEREPTDIERAKGADIVWIWNHPVPGEYVFNAGSKTITLVVGNVEDAVYIDASAKEPGDGSLERPHRNMAEWYGAQHEVRRD